MSFSFQNLTLLFNFVKERLHSRMEHALSRVPLDLDYLEFVCSQELVFLSAISPQMHMPRDIADALRQLHNSIDVAKHGNRHTVVAQLEQGGIGRPKVAIGRENLTSLLEMNFPVSCIAGL